MLAPTLGGMLFALLPLALHHLGIPSGTMWLVTELGLALYIVAMAIYLRSFRLRWLQAERMMPSPMLSYLVPSIVVPLPPLLVLSAVDSYVPRGLGALSVALLALLLVGSVFLVYFLATLSAEE